MPDVAPKLIMLDASKFIWERFFTVFPLVVVGTSSRARQPCSLIAARISSAKMMSSTVLWLWKAQPRDAFPERCTASNDSLWPFRHGTLKSTNSRTCSFPELIFRNIS